MAPCRIVRRVLEVEARVSTNNTRRQTLVGLSIDHWMITGQVQAFTKERPTESCRQWPSFESDANSDFRNQATSIFGTSTDVPPLLSATTLA